MTNRTNLFSDRNGYVQPQAIQYQSMSDDLRNQIWSYFCALLDATELKKVWTCHLCKPSDEVLSTGNPYGFTVDNEFIKKICLFDEWYEVFDLIEFCLKFMGSNEIRESIVVLNEILRIENSAYKIVDSVVVEITSEQEIAEIEKACNAPYSNACKHIKKAVKLFSNRNNPDYENVIKESITAVESVAQCVTNKTDKSLNALTQSLQMHKNFCNGINELYNWTSSDGIRHASGNSLPKDQNTARFMLVICSSFVNYIIATHESRK